MVELVIFFVGLMLGLLLAKMHAEQERKETTVALQQMQQTILDLVGEIDRLTGELEQWRHEALSEDDGEGWKTV